MLKGKRIIILSGDKVIRDAVRIKYILIRCETKRKSVAYILIKRFAQGY